MVVRNEDEIKYVKQQLTDIMDTIKKNPSCVKKTTGGNVPEIISNFQTSYTFDLANTINNVLDWILCNENGVSQMLVQLNEKLKNVQ